MQHEAPIPASRSFLADRNGGLTYDLTSRQNTNGDQQERHVLKHLNDALVASRDRPNSYGNSNVCLCKTNTLCVPPWTSTSTIGRHCAR
eukprot:6253925-Amphidinium_carterae.1